jgi:hypothetical protein
MTEDMSIEFRGADLDDKVDYLRWARFFVVSEEPLEGMEQDVLRELVDSWYSVGFNGGFEGCWLHQLSTVVFDPPEGPVVFRFAVVGYLTREAIDVVLRCFRSCEDPRFDTLLPRAHVEVGDYRLFKTGEGVEGVLKAG